MKPFDLTLSCTLPGPIKGPHTEPIEGRERYAVSWSLRDTDGTVVAEGDMQSVYDEKETHVWMAYWPAQNWLRDLKLPVARITVNHPDPKAREVLARAKADPVSVRKGEAMFLIEFLNSRSYPWEIGA